MFFANEIERCRYQRHYTDFEALLIPGALTAVAGTGAQVTLVAPQTADQVGVHKYEVGTTSTGVAGWSTAVAVARLDAGGKWKLEMSLRSAANLSDGTDTYTVRAGFLDSIAAEPTDGVFFRYSHGLSAGNLQAVARQNGTETVVATPIVWAINTTYILDIEVLGDGSKAFFSVNGVPVASITTNIPVGAGRETGWGAFSLKSLGTANKGEFYMDYSDVVCVFK